MIAAPPKAWLIAGSVISFESLPDDHAVKDVVNAVRLGRDINVLGQRQRPRRRALAMSVATLRAITYR
jgi:hypothetical protein